MDRHSRLVAFLKVLLPLAALGILSTLFLLSRSVDPTATIPFAEQEIAERMQGQQITAPRFSGTTPRGDEVRLTATKALPGGAGRPGMAENLEGEIHLADGAVVTIRADTGIVNVPNDHAEFTGEVTITTDAGYRLVTERLESGIRTLQVTSPGPVSGTGPVGQIDAGSMEITVENSKAPAHMVFKNGVKLVYDPRLSQE